MEQAEAGDHRMLRVNPDQWSADSHNLAELLSDIASSIGELERKNSRLEQERIRLEARNAELQRALQDGDERAAELERAAARTTETARRALSMAAQILGNVQKSLGLARAAAKAESATVHEGSINRILELQSEILSTLRQSQEESALRYREAVRKSAETLAEACEAIQSMAQHLDIPFSGQSLTPPLGLFAEQQDAGDEDAPPARAADPATLFSHANVENVGEIHPALGIEPALTEAAASRETTQSHPSKTSIELVASPFGSFAQLSGFHKAVERLPGVIEVRARAFDKGTLRLAVEYESPAPLIDHLMELSQFNLRLESMDNSRIEVRIDGAGA